MTPTARLAILEPNHDGHRYLLVRLLAAAAPGPVLLLTSAAGAASRQFELHLAPLAAAGSLTVRVVGDGGGRLRVARSLAGVDVVVVPDADRSLRWCAALAAGARCRVRGVLLRPARPLGLYPGPAAAARGWVKVLLAAALTVASGRRIAFRQLDLPGTSRSRLRLTRLLPPVGDPIPPAARAPAVEGRRRGLLLVGALSARKGVDAVVERWRALGLDEPLVLVGRLDPDIGESTRAELDRLVDDGRAHVDDRYVADDEVDAAVRSARAVLLPYGRETWSSGILGRAVRNRTPVVVVGPASGVSATVVDAGLGAWIDDLDGLPAALARLDAEGGAIAAALAAYDARMDDGSDFAAALWGEGTRSLRA